MDVCIGSYRHPRHKYADGVEHSSNSTPQRSNNFTQTGDKQYQGIIGSRGSPICLRTHLISLTSSLSSNQPQKRKTPAPSPTTSQSIATQIQSKPTISSYPIPSSLYCQVTTSKFALADPRRYFSSTDTLYAESLGYIYMKEINVLVVLKRKERRGAAVTKVLDCQYHLWYCTVFILPVVLGGSFLCWVKSDDIYLPKVSKVF